jgi:hypothetical protein
MIHTTQKKRKLAVRPNSSCEDEDEDEAKDASNSSGYSTAVAPTEHVQASTTGASDVPKATLLAANTSMASAK